MNDDARQPFNEYQTAIALATLHCGIDYDATASDSHVETLLSRRIAKAADPARAAGVLFGFCLVVEQILDLLHREAAEVLPDLAFRPA